MLPAVSFSIVGCTMLPMGYPQWRGSATTGNPFCAGMSLDIPVMELLE